MSEVLVVEYRNLWFVGITYHCSIKNVIKYGKRNLTQNDAMTYAKSIDNTQYGIHVYKEIK